MKYVKLLMENVYLVDPKSFNVIYSIHTEVMNQRGGSGEGFNISELFDDETFKLLNSKIQFLVLNEELDEITLIEKREDELEGSNMFSIKVSKIQHLANSMLEIKVGVIKKLRYKEIINVKEISRSLMN
jgi:hypothetical protein